MIIAALGGFSMAFKGSPPVFILLLLLSLIWTVFVYRRTLPPVKTGLRILLAVLRFTAYGILLFLIFEPTVSYHHRQERKPLLPVLIDDSQSMRLDETSGSRAQQLEAVLNDPVWSALGKKFELVYYAFNDSLRRLETLSMDQLDLNAIGTDLNGAWEALSQTLKTETYAACVLISDGGDNAGGDPIAGAQKTVVPIYTVGIGDTTAVRDARIESLAGDRIAYSGKKAHLTVRCKAVGMEHQRARVELLDEENRIITGQNITLPADGLLTEAMLEFTLKKAGNAALKVRLVTSGAERSLDNNVRTYTLKVRESRIRVLLVYGYPSFESLFFQRAVADLSDVEITSVALQGEKKNASPVDRVNFTDALSNTDVIVLINLPRTEEGKTALRRLERAVTERPLPVWIWFGTEFNAKTLQALCGEAPVRFIPARVKGTGAPSPDHFYAQLDPDAESEEAGLWRDLPPVQLPPYKTRLQSPAKVLISLNDAETGQTLSPALVIWEENQRRAALSIGSGYWRWQFLSEGLTNNAELYSGMIFKMLRWLTTKPQRRPLRLVSDKALYSSGEKVHFDAQVFSGEGKATRSAQVEVLLDGPEGGAKILLEADAFGHYLGSYQPEGVGNYHFTGKATVNGEPAGADSGSFTVEAYNIEKETLRQNRKLLQAIAASSGGTYVAADSIGALPALIQAPPRFVDTGWSRRFFLNWDVLLLIVGVLCLEWLIRKRSGML